MIKTPDSSGNACIDTMDCSTEVSSGEDSTKVSCDGSEADGVMDGASGSLDETAGA